MLEASWDPLWQKIYRTWTRKLLDKLQILNEINTEKISCWDRDYLQEETKAETLQAIPRVTVLGRMHVNWSKTFHLFRKKVISPSLQVTDQSTKQVPKSAKSLKQDLWRVLRTLCALLAFNPDLTSPGKPSKNFSSLPEMT